MEFFLAFLGGIILNIMPCVFPVLSLKVLALANLQHNRLLSSISYTAGILISFLVISGTLVLLKEIGIMVGWGYNLQSPTFVIFLTYLLFIIGLNLSGFFEVPMFAFTEPKVRNIIGHFSTGILAVLVATPCTAPFMATAVGFAFTQPPIITLAIFQILGLGFAFPYFLLSVSPKLLSFLPKPGKWTQTLKEFLAFPMYISSAWLLWVATKQSNSNLVLTIAIGLTIIVMSIWSWQFIKPLKGTWKHCWIIILLFINIAPVKMSYELINHGYEQQQITFSTQTLQQALAEKSKVLVVVSADWCITCKINEQMVLLTSKVQNELKKHHVIYMFADWTKRDENITEYIHSFNRNGVPLYILYDSKGNYKILPQILTQNIILQNLEEAK